VETTRPDRFAVSSPPTPVQRFAVSDNSTYNFTERLSGRVRNFFTFRITDILVSRTDLKLSILVQRQSLDLGPADFGPNNHCSNSPRIAWVGCAGCTKRCKRFGLAVPNDVVTCNHVHMIVHGNSGDPCDSQRFWNIESVI